jgi:hypothetical protein
LTHFSDARRDRRPPWQLPRASERVVSFRVNGDAHGGEALEHDERVVRPAAQRLRACEHRHERRVVPRSELNRAPGEIVKGLVLAAIRRVERQLTALAPL